MCSAGPSVVVVRVRHSVVRVARARATVAVVRVAAKPDSINNIVLSDRFVACHFVVNSGDWATVRQRSR